jgi:hypothetical protein
VNERTKAAELLRIGLVGRTITRVMLDFSVTLAFAGERDAKLKIETGFQLRSPRGHARIDPAAPGDHASSAVGLFNQTVIDVGLSEDGTLMLAIPTTNLALPADATYEAWSFTDSAGGRVVCMPGGALAIGSRLGQAG